MNNKGQAVASEYVMIFFVVIAAVVAMTTYVQRAYEARIHDARNYMVDSLISSGACDANCQAAAGNQIFPEYEPYYSGMLSDIQQNQQKTTTAAPGNPSVIGVTYSKSLDENTQTNSSSCQLPPLCADISGPLPCECQCPPTC